MKRSSVLIALPTAFVVALCGCDGPRDEAPVSVDGSAAQAVTPALAPVEPEAKPADTGRPEPATDAAPLAAVEEEPDPAEPTGEKPTVYFGRMVVKGSLSKEIILRILRRRVSALLGCYQRGLKRKPGLRGRVAVKFIISPTGLVQHASLDRSTLGDKQVERCVVETIKGTKFPSCGGGGIVIVTVPIVLTLE